MTKALFSRRARGKPVPALLIGFLVTGFLSGCASLDDERVEHQDDFVARRHFIRAGSVPFLPIVKWVRSGYVNRPSETKRRAMKTRQLFEMEAREKSRAVVWRIHASEAFGDEFIDMAAPLLTDITQYITEFSLAPPLDIQIDLILVDADLPTRASFLDYYVSKPRLRFWLPLTPKGSKESITAKILDGLDVIPHELVHFRNGTRTGKPDTAGLIAEEASAYAAGECWKLWRMRHDPEMSMTVIARSLPNLAEARRLFDRYGPTVLGYIAANRSLYFQDNTRKLEIDGSNVESYYARCERLISSPSLKGVWKPGIAAGDS